jgi:hypothetical protein
MRKAALALSGAGLLLALVALVLGWVSAPSDCETPRGDKIAWDLGWIAAGVILASALAAVAVAIRPRDPRALLVGGVALALAIGAGVADWFALRLAFDLYLCFDWGF